LSVTERIRVIEAIVKTPIYMVLGYTYGRVVYVSNEEGVVSLWSLDPKTGLKRRLTVEPIHSFTEPKHVSPLIVYTRDVTKGKELQKVYHVDVRDGEEKLLADTPLMRIFGIAFDGVKSAFTGATMEDLAIYIARTDGSWEKLKKLDAISFVTDVNEDYIVGFGTLRGDPKTYEIFIYNLSSGEFKVYTPKEGSVSKVPKLFKDKMLFENNFEGKNRLYIYNIEADRLEKVRFTYTDYDRFNPIEHVDYGWTVDGKVWTIAKRDGRTKAFIDGKEVPTPLGYLSGMAILNDKVYLSHSTLTTPPKIFEVDLKTNELKVVIDNKLPRDVEESLGSTRFVKYRSFDGLAIPAFLVECRKTSKPGPSIIYVHGGPWSEVADMWNVLIASLVASGFHVLAPNFRGSIGYGEEFRMLDIGDPGGGDLKDIVYAREWAVKSRLADKIAITGYSYGGYMTLLALGRFPDLWSCGVAGASVIDWEEMYGLSDAIFKKFIETLFANKKELLKERSPITYVENVKAPLCIVHPQNDTRTPLKPVLKYLSKLLELGKTFEVHIAPDMGHIITTMDDALKIVLPTIMFLEKHLK